MTTENENVVVNGAQSTTKKARRGVSNQTKSVNQLKFHEKDASSANGLFVAHLDSVTLDWSVNSEGKQFTGLKVPRVTLHFASNHTNANEQRHVYYTINPVESNVNTISGGSEEWKVNSVMSWFKHMLDVFYLKGREFTEEEENALALNLEDYDINSDGTVEYISVEPEEVLAAYAAMFTNFVAMMNGSWNLEEGATPKACFKTADGKYLPCWIKLLRHKRIKGEWKNVANNGELAFDPFIGSGVVELVRKDKAPVLFVDFVKESITPKEIKKVPSIGTPAMGAPMMGGIMAGSPIGMSMGGYSDNDAAAAADTEMPF